MTQGQKPSNKAKMKTSTQRAGGTGTSKRRGGTPSLDFARTQLQAALCHPDRSGNAAANRLEAAIARIARREGDPHENRERAQRIKRDILVARRLRGGLAPALKHAWGEPVD